MAEDLSNPFGDEAQRQPDEPESQRVGFAPAELRPADPANDTQLGRRTVRPWGEEVEIHETSNLFRLVGAFLHKQQGRAPANPLEVHYYNDLEANNGAAERLLEELMRHNPEQAARLTQTVIRYDILLDARANRLPRIPELTPAEKDQKDYWMSVAFDDLVRLAPPDFPYDIADLCR